MAGVYCADVFCDDCIEKIKDDIAQDLWDEKESAACPDGEEVALFESCAALNEYLRGMDERAYDSGEYPKYCSDDEESDSPQHCGSHEDCENADSLEDGFKFGCFLQNPLTSAGYDYVREAVRDSGEGSVAALVWAPFYEIEDNDAFEDDDTFEDEE